MTRARTVAMLAWLALGSLTSGCSTPAEGRVDSASLDPASFPPVSNMLLRRCGSLDCHGSQYRNLRLVGFGASRLAPGELPGGGPTTADEHTYNYQGVISLEPETIADVAASKGAKLSELTLVRKARGEEAHKGDQRITAGDDADKCLVAWLSGARNDAACDAAAKAP